MENVPHSIYEIHVHEESSSFFEDAIKESVMTECFYF